MAEEGGEGGEVALVLEEDEEEAVERELWPEHLCRGARTSEVRES